MSDGVRLVGAHVVVREHGPGDLEAMHRWRGSPTVMRFVSFGSANLDETRAALEEAIAEQARPERTKWYLAVELRETGEVVGSVGFDLRRDASGAREAGFGWFIASAHHGSGYGADAAGLLVDFALSELGVDRVVATCDARNVASERVMQRCGMRRVGERPRRNRAGTRVFYLRGGPKERA